MDVSLKVLAGAKVGAKVPVRKDKFVIGRAAECHLTVGTTSISRRHCVLRRKENEVTVEDLGSRNGTFVNGERITEEVSLAGGDEIALGPLVFQVRMSTGLSNAKQPKVESVAEAIQRTAKQAEHIDDDDISSWLLGPATPSTATKETQTIQLDETNAGQPSESTEKDAGDSDVLSEEGEQQGSPKESKGPGKLPFRPEKPKAKDSCEAAEMALRNWSRRR